MAERCPNCGAPIKSASATVCPFCNKPLPENAVELTVSETQPQIVRKVFQDAVSTKREGGRGSRAGRLQGRQNATQSEDSVAYTTAPIPGGVAITGARGCCGSLRIPESIDGQTVLEVGEEAFRGRSDLLDVLLPDTLECVADRAFEQCASLSSFTGGKGLTRIGDGAFRGCIRLINVQLSGKPDAYYSSFAGCYALGTLIENKLNLERKGE